MITVSGRARLILLLGDLLVLLFFVAEGMREHETIDAGNPFLDVAVTALYYVPLWLAAAWLLGAYPRGNVSGRGLLARSLNAWLVAAPLATLVRAYALGRVIIPTPFLLVTLTLPAGLLLLWRLVFVWCVPWRRSR